MISIDDIMIRGNSNEAQLRAFDQQLELLNKLIELHESVANADQQPALMLVLNSRVGGAAS